MSFVCTNITVVYRDLAFGELGCYHDIFSTHSHVSSFRVPHNISKYLYILFKSVLGLL